MKYTVWVDEERLSEELPYDSAMKRAFTLAEENPRRSVLVKNAAEQTVYSASIMADEEENYFFWGIRD